MDSWFEKWFDENYLLLYFHRNRRDAMEQRELIVREVSPGKNWKMLDLACGEGRHVQLFKEKGYRTFGMDLSETLLKNGKRKFYQIDLIRGDMRSIPGKFDMIMSLFTSFGYFMRDEDNIKVISEIYDSLEENGVFWLDFLNPLFVKTNLVSENKKELPDGIKVIEKRKIVDGRVEKEIEFVKRDEKKVYKESVRLFSRENLIDILQKAGFKIVKIFGDYKGSLWRESSERTIIFSKKNRIS